MHYSNYNYITLTHLVSPIEIVTIGEDRCKVALALASNIMMIIMVLCTPVKGDEFCKTQRKVVPVLPVLVTWNGDHIDKLLLTINSFLNCPEII